MKIIIVFILVILSLIGILITSIWAPIDFIIYLVKDKPFNMWLLYGFIISVVSFFVNYILLKLLQDPIVQYNLRNRQLEKIKKSKSKWEKAKEIGDNLNNKK